MKEAGLEVRLNNFIIHDVDFGFNTAWNVEHTYILIKNEKVDELDERRGRILLLRDIEWKMHNSACMCVCCYHFFINQIEIPYLISNSWTKQQPLLDFFLSWMSITRHEKISLVALPGTRI